MAMRGTVRDVDHGYNELKKRWINHKSNRGAVVGIFGAGAAQGHGEDATNLLVALIHEFGAPSAGIPARSWLRAWIDENADEVRRRIRELGKRVISGQLLHDAALEQLGLWIVGRIQARIANKIAPPLKPATVRKRLASDSRKAAVARRKMERARKGALEGGASREEAGDAGTAAAAADLTPLIDTGQFRQAITYEVRNR